MVDKGKRHLIELKSQEQKPNKDIKKLSPELLQNKQKTLILKINTMGWKYRITEEEYPILSNYDINYLERILTRLLKATNPNQEVFTDKDYLYQADLFEMEVKMSGESWID